MLFSNSTERKDFIENYILRNKSAKEIRIASAFFTNADLLLQCAEAGAEIRLIVRLGFPTSAQALLRAYKHPRISVRFFTSTSFHPKFYLFDDVSALVGSANLTAPGVRDNQEVAVSLEGGDLAFEDIDVLFENYWEEAVPLTQEAIQSLGKWTLHHASNVERDIQAKIEAEIGQSAYKNIGRETKKKTKEEKTYDGYLRRYQMLLKHIEEVTSIYAEIGRKLAPPDFPLRLEVDSFLSYIRHNQATGDSYVDAPVRERNDRKNLISGLANEFNDRGYEYLTNEIVPINYPALMRVFASPEKLEQATLEEIYASLVTVHAFHELLRFNLGGEPALRRHFLSENEESRVKNTLSYLLFEPDHRTDWRRRVARCIHDDRYCLVSFGKSCVQELYGWVNQNDVPICNDRTVKVLRWLGFPFVLT